jgi:hypothetical protein
MGSRGVSVSEISEIFEGLNTMLQERNKLVDMLLSVKDRNGQEPEQILYGLLRDREVVVSLLKKSGAIKQVGVDYISAHLRWLAPKYLKPVRWPGRPDREVKKSEL